MTDAQYKLEIYLAHHRELLDYATSLAGTRSTAEDIVQDAWLRFSSSRSTHELNNPAGYLFRIVRNLALDISRRTLTEQHVSNSEEQLLELPANSPSLEAQISDQNDLHVIAHALTQLPARTRSAFEMHRLHGCTFAEIASHLSISIGLAHQLVRDALTHCASKLYQDD